MPARNTQPKAKEPSSEYKAIAAQWAKAERQRKAEKAKASESKRTQAEDPQRVALERKRKAAFESRCIWTVGFWIWMTCIHAIGIALFTSGFLLTRLVLDEKSDCANPPIEPLLQWPGQGTIEGGCWHPKQFNKAVIVIIDALRYDFTVPVAAENDPQIYHNALKFLHESAVKSPSNAFLRPFIADPPTATLQRLKGLTTGTLPTFIDIGSNFAGTAIEEDNLLSQLKDQGKRIVHLGDDTWTSLFPGYFEPNISRAYDSFNVWDIHTVDNGVIDNIFPLLQPERTGEWDVLIGHLLGVDHVGHKTGPGDSTMTSKLEQMDGFVRQLAESVDDDTLLVVMGDHGMDGKGDHGGESDDEVEAALWMYSKNPAFGRTEPEFSIPPENAKIRPVNQIDLVPTLALLLGIPIPYNNLGRPIEETFAGLTGSAWDHLASASSMASAAIKRYQASYFEARGIEQGSGSGSSAEFWEAALSSSQSGSWKAAYDDFVRFQEVTLAVCKDLWARFDVPKMIMGISVMAFGVIVLILYVTRDEDEDFAVLDDVDLQFAENSLEILAESTPEAPSYRTLTKSLVKSALFSSVLGAVLGVGVVVLMGSGDWLLPVATAAIASMISVTVSLFGYGKRIVDLCPNTIWGWMSIVFTLSQSIGFASNSFTIWEDSISLFFLSTFGLVSVMAAFRRPTFAERALGIYHSILFVLLGRLASFSKLCREEQMPYCTSTYYSSANSTTSAPWQLAIPFFVVLILPSIVRSYLATSRSYEGLAPAWIGYIFRFGLFLSAIYWTLDAAANGGWFDSIDEETLKTIQVFLAQFVLALAVVAGTTAFGWAPPCVSVLQTAPKPGQTSQVVVLGYANAHGARYLLLPLNLLATLILVTKPVGSGALTIMIWQILSLLEIVDLNDLSNETIGPVILAVLGSFHYFKTGHQMVLASIQWDSAFVALFSIRYPWSPLLVMLNTFAGQIVATATVPLLVLWKAGPKRKGIIESASRVLGLLVSYYAIESLATMAWAGYLRRHLMLFRVFSPRFILGAITLIVVDVVGIVVALLGVRTNVLSISEVFGFAD